MDLYYERTKYIKAYRKLLAAILLITALGIADVVIAAADGATIPVYSPAFVFSPGNWTGDEGRSGNVFRQTWYPGAYFRIAWETSNPKPMAKILMDTSTYSSVFKPPMIAYCIDGVWKSRVQCSPEVNIEEISGTGKHELLVMLQCSEQKERWGSDGKSGLNVLRVTGLQVDSESKPLAATPRPKWGLIIGDSITEGIGTSELSGYSHLVGQALQTQGYEYCISACGWSGWLRPGDSSGDVPGYYVINNSQNGAGGEYDDTASRWNKIDGNKHSLMDSAGHISANGQTGQEPAMILINYGTNDSLRKPKNPSDISASITQSLAALRKSAPEAQIIILIPFGQYCAKELRESVEMHKRNNPSDSKVSIIDLGPDVAKTLAAKNGLMSGLHPNDRGHANFAAKIIPQVIMTISPEGK